MRLAWLIPLVSLLSVGCGTVDKPPVDADIDAARPPDAGPPDADPLSLCNMYCDCMELNCGGSFPSREACLTECAALDPVDQDCRNYHCGMAVGGQAAVHCPHARGEAICN